jgi:energy-coupling factor transporter ATP-binding protein EcfA2
MGKRGSRASLSKGRLGWCAIFYHPVARTDNGKPRRIRRGLGTTDEAKARALVEQLNSLIDDATMHSPASRERAAATFDPVVVSTFYEPLQPETHDGWAIRERTIALPGGRDADDGYARVLFVGTTGAGKTTVLRQIIGTDPRSERFPSISAAKTTICDIEVILRTGDFEAVVTFIARDRVRQYIAECVLAAVTTHLEGSPERDVIRRFLEHHEQRFRLSYILGNPLSLRQSPSEEELFDADEGDVDSDDEESLPDEQKVQLHKALTGYLDRLRRLAEDSRCCLDRLAAEFGINVAEATEQDRDVLQELESLNNGATVADE